MKLLNNFIRGQSNDHFCEFWLNSTPWFRRCCLSAGSDKIHAKSKFLSTWWSTDFSKNYTVGRYMDLLFSPNLFFLKSFALLRKSGLYFLTIILTFSLKSTGKRWRKSATFFATCVDEDGNVTCTDMKLNY